VRLLVIALVAGCTSSAAAPGLPRTYDEAQAMLVEAQCDRKVRCGEIGASERAACLADPNDAKSMGYGAAWFREQADAIASGRLRFDPTKLADCLAAVRAPCSAEPSATCKRLLAPGVKPGGACTRWDECIDGHCSAQLGCTGHCVAHKHLGDKCSSSGNDGLCGDDTFCDRGRYGLGEAVCKAKLATGAKCRAWDSCHEGQCIGYMTVREEPGAPEEERLGTCTLPGAAGAACRTDYARDCAEGFACDWETKKCNARVAKGSACRSPESCADGLACAGLEAMWDPHTAVWRVGTPGTCIPTLDLGAHCDVLANAIATGCPRTSTCDAKSGTCVHESLAGNACHPNGGCRGNLYCEPKTLTCAPELPFGAACKPPAEGGDDPCSLGKCDPKRRVCVPLQACGKS